MKTCQPCVRSLSLALLAASALALTGCPPKESAKPDAAAITVEPAKPDSGASATAADRSATSSANPEIKGLDPTPPLSRTDMGNGLVIEDLKMGTGDIVWPASSVLVHIRGWAVSTGNMYWDTQTQEKKPHQIDLKKAMKGMREGIPGMRVGGKRRLSIPVDKAYGFKEVKNDKGEVVVPQGSSVVLEIEAVQTLSTVKTEEPADSAAGSTPAGAAAPK